MIDLNLNPFRLEPIDLGGRKARMPRALPRGSKTAI